MSAAFDLLLCAAALGIGLRLLFCRSSFDAIVLFVGFGLLLTLAWARLSAPDIALAEAAIGSSVSGVLLLEAYQALRQKRATHPELAGSPNTTRPVLILAVAVLAVALFVLLAKGIWQLPEQTIVLAEAVIENLADSGVTHPVTAVLLNFRGYDTLLEVGVVIIALVAVLAVRSETQMSYPPPSMQLSRGVSVVVIPSLVLLAFYILWAGATQPGGAFQAAALFAAAILLSDFRAQNQLAQKLWRGAPALVVSGLAVFILVALLGMQWGAVLTLPTEIAGSLILAVELFLMMSLGIALALFVYALVPLAGSKNSTDINSGEAR